jgi:electron transfer flavoprotein beta subunit
MLIAVCIKQVPSPESRVRVNAAGTWIREEDVSWTLNEPDAYALEEALRLKETHGGEVIVLSAGPARVAIVLREALARGADRAVHVVTDRPESAADPQVTATMLAEVLTDAGADLVLTGLQSDDYGFAQVGVLLAEQLGISHATIVMNVEIGDGRVRVKRELEGGMFQWLTMPLPAALTIQSGINQLRYATLRGIMAAKKKELRTIPAPRVAPSQRILNVSPVSRRTGTRLLDGTPAEAAAMLANLLSQRDGGQVIK